MNLPFCMPSDHRIAGTRNWGRVQGVTLAPVGRTQGQREFLCFQPGFYVAMGQLVHREDRRDVYPSGDFFKLHFRLAGESRVAQASAYGSQPIAAGSVTTLVQPRDSFKEEFFAAGAEERSVTVCCSRSFLGDALGLDAATHALDPIGDYMQDARLRFELLQAPMDATQYALASALLDSRPNDPYRALYAEAKAVELLHSFLARTPMTAGVANRAATVQDRLVPVKAHIDRHLGEALDMHGLALHFGMSESRLARSFRAAFGVTVFEYIGQARLQQARALIEGGRMAVTDVAFQVGYSHVANFSTAFKRAFGKSPQAMRKEARAAAG